MPIDDINTDGEYLQRLADRNKSATFQRILDEMGGAETTGQGTGPGVAPDQPAAPSSSKPTAAPAGGEGGGMLSKIGTVAKNTAYGTIMELVPQLIAGRFEAVKNAGKSVGEFGSWIDQNAPWLSDPDAVNQRKQFDEYLNQYEKEHGISHEFSSQNILGIGGEPTTGIGQFARAVSKFMTFYSPAMTGLGAGGLTGFMASPIAGGVSQFLSQDPHEAGLSNILKQFPTLEPVVGMLATNPDDPELLNRAKHAVEGVATGVAAEGITRAVKAGAHWLFARKAAQEVAGATPEMTAQAQAQAQEAEQMVGAYDKGAVAGGKPFTITTTKEAAAAKLADVAADVGPSVPGQVTAGAIKRAAALDDISVKVNWQNIDKGNLRGFIGDVAGEMKGRIQAAKRGEISLQAQTKMADALGMTNEDLLARGIGKTFNSEEFIAGEKLLNASQAELYRLAHIAEMPFSSAVDAIKVNEQMVTHMGLLEQFLGATGEWGRAGRAIREAHRIGAIARAQFMKAFLENSGGIEGARNLSTMLVDLENQGVPPGAVNAALKRAGWGSWTWDAFKEAWGLGFLWGPKTHMRNIIGNTAYAMQQSSDIGMASRFARLLGHEPADMVFPQEAMAYQTGQLAALRKAFSIAGQSFKTGERQFAKLYVTNPLTEAGGAMQPNMPPALSSQGVANQLGKDAIAAQAFTETPFGKAIDLIGSVTRLPGRFLSAADDWFKVVGAEGNAYQMATRKALSEGLTGPALADKVAEYLTNRPPWLTMAGIDHAAYVTFNDAPTPWGQAVMNLRGNVQPLFIAIPYVRTPANLFKIAVEHSPLAPILKGFRTDFAAGGAARELALAKMTTGSIMMSLLADFAHNGHLSGKGPATPAELEAWRGAGRLPYALHLGKVNIGVSGLGQLAPALAFAGALDDMFKKRDLHPEAFDSVDEMIGTGIAIMSQSLVDQSYLQGFARFTGMLTEHAAGQAGAAGAWGRDIAGSMSNLMPGVAAARAIGAALDPQQRQIANLWDAMIFQKIPGLADKLIPIRDVFGHEIVQQPVGKAGQLYNFISPFRLSWDIKHPAFNEMVRLNTGINKLNWTSNFMGVDVNFRDHPEVLDYWRRLMGNELKMHPATHEKIGLEDFLNRVIIGKDPVYSAQYKTLSDTGDTGVDSGKGTFIKHWAAQYRAAAAKQIMAEAPWRFPDFYAEIAKGMLHKEQQKLRSFEPPQMAAQKLQIQQQMARPLQPPLPDRFGRPSVQPSRGGEFTVPTGR